MSCKVRNCVFYSIRFVIVYTMGVWNLGSYSHIRSFNLLLHSHSSHSVRFLLTDLLVYVMRCRHNANTQHAKKVFFFSFRKEVWPGMFSHMHRNVKEFHKKHAMNFHLFTSYACLRIISADL